MNDILLLEINDLNAVLTEHLLHKLFVPLYIFSLTPAPPPPSLAVVTQNLAAVLNRNVNIDIQDMNNPRVSSIVALYLLSLVFLVVTHAPLVHALAWVILNGDHSVFKEGAAEVLNAYVEHREIVVPSFGEPRESLEESLDTVVGTHTNLYLYDANESIDDNDTASSATTPSTSASTTPPHATSSNTQNIEIDGAIAAITTPPTTDASTTNHSKKMCNITDEEKEKLQKLITPQNVAADINRPFLDMVLAALDCVENDYLALLALCLIYAMAYNRGIDKFLFFFIINLLYKKKHYPI